MFFSLFNEGKIIFLKKVFIALFCAIWMIALFFFFFLCVYGKCVYNFFIRCVDPKFFGS